MVLCIVAAFVFAVMSIFSAKYRPLAKEGFRCVFRTLMLKPCDTGLDEKIKSQLVSSLLRFPALAKFVNKQFTVLSWIFVILSVASFAYMIYGAYNFWQFGNCEGPDVVNACVLNDLTGDYGRFSAPTDLVTPTSYAGLAYGNPNAPHKVIEFGCFTCPYTKKAEDTVQQLLKRNDVYYVFKPFPLPNHNYSFEAAQAVLCARNQGKEWELRERIFDQQEVCSADGTIAIKEIANKSGLDMVVFNNCYDTNATAQELQKYVQEGKGAHIYATPTFFVNGKPLVGPKTYDQMRCEIDQKSVVQSIGCLFGQWWN